MLPFSGFAGKRSAPMAIYRNENASRDANQTERTRSPAAWIIGITLFLALLGGLFIYDGRNAKTVPGPNTPNVVNNPTGSK
jgi:hypothetical protein